MAFDAELVIVGGGPAGTATALSLAHAAPALAGRVVLFERARYPRDKPCAGAIGGRGDALLLALDARVDVESVPIDGISFRGRRGESCAAPGSIGRVVRRREFDHALAGAAASRGVTVRDGVSVDGIRDEGEAGVVLETSAGCVRARAVVGCDGVGSIVRRSLGIGWGGLRAQAVEVDTEPTVGDRDRALLHFDASDPTLPGYYWEFPTVVGGRPLVSRGIYRLRTDGMGARSREPAPPGSASAGLGALLDDRLRALGLDAVACQTKRYSERGFESATRLASGGRMLVGEAAGIDAVTGEGIAQAIEYGVLAGRYLANVFRRSPAGRALDVRGWDRAMKRSRLARDLRIRSRFLRLYYGPYRHDLERFVVDCPEALFVGAQHFAAQRSHWLAMGRVALQGAVRVIARNRSSEARRPPW
jgi:flavin-dependent dehydrogenase